MKNSFKKVLSGMLMASTASMASANPDMNISNIVNDMLSSGKKISVSNSLNRKLQKYIIKFGNGGAYVVAGHQSHRSHRSHSSHRSSSGSYYGGSSSSSSSATRSTSTRTTTPATTTSSSVKEQPVKVTDTEFNYETSKPTQPKVDNGNYIFGLGDRTLQVGCIGTDVKVLAALLQKHGFIEASAIKTNADGYVIYNDAIAAGVKKFQKAASLPVTGIADSKTITALRNYGK